MPENKGRVSDSLIKSLRTGNSGDLPKVNPADFPISPDGQVVQPQAPQGNNQGGQNSQE